jgi:hypothetical protein
MYGLGFLGYLLGVYSIFGKDIGREYLYVSVGTRHNA